MFNIILFLIPAIFFNFSLNVFYEFKRLFGFIKFDYPFDFKIKFFDGNRILGESTTWGGLLVVILLGFISDFWLDIGFSLILFGLLVFFGHALGSFIKRRFNYERGRFMPIIDHGDYIIFSGIFFLINNKIEFNTFIISLLLVLLFQPLVTFIFYKIGLRDNPL